MSTPIYLQLYSLRKETAADAESVVRKVKALGYDGVELAGDYGWTHDHWKNVLSETGLVALGTHAGLDSALNTIPFAKALGLKYLIVPYLDQKYQTPDGYREAAKKLNEIGKQAKEAGLKFAYHHHDFEFKKLETGERGIDILMNETDPELVSFQVDTYWVDKGGDIAGTFVQEKAPRISILHMKDYDKSTGEDTPCGKGGVHLPPVIQAAQSNNWPMVVEYEGGDALEAVKASADYLRSALN